MDDTFTAKTAKITSLENLYVYGNSFPVFIMTILFYLSVGSCVMLFVPLVFCCAVVIIVYLVLCVVYIYVHIIVCLLQGAVGFANCVEFKISINQLINRIRQLPKQI